MNYTQLLKIMLKKEKIHYKRLFGMFEHCKGFGGKAIIFPLVFIMVTIAHYCFASMHFIFETFLYFKNREQFNLNIINISR